MIKEIIIKEVASLIFKTASNQIKQLNFFSNSKEVDVIDSLNNHIKYVKNWSNEINFKDLLKSKKTYQVYIPLNLFLTPLRSKIDYGENFNQAPLLDVFKNNETHIVILGQPGAGKTTSMKFICQSIFFNQNFYPNEFKIPLLIRLREFNKPVDEKISAGIIIEFLFNLFAFSIKERKAENDALIQNTTRLKLKTVVEILNKEKFLIIIEGFDELSTKKNRKIVIDEIISLSNYLEVSKMLVTSRTADFNFSFENLSVFEICPLNQKQILEFSRKWLGSPEKAKDFFSAVSKSPFFDTTIRPLTIAHLCAIYERNNKIPDKPKTVYKKIIHLLLEEWDEQRNLERVSSYGNFEVDRKFEFLSALAYRLTVSTNKSYFSKNDLEIAYENIHEDFDLKRNEMDFVIKEIESHTGLFIQSGFENFEFAHKSLQEYLTAEYLVKLPKIIKNQTTIERLANEFAITIAISSKPSEYFVHFVLGRLVNMKGNSRFIYVFINRLILEKPDFNKNHTVAITALIVYTIYLDVYIENTEQLSLFVTDDLASEFESLIHDVTKRNSFELIFDSYEEFSRIPSSHSNLIITYKLKNTDLSIDGIKFPEFLRFRSTFLNKN